MKKPKILFLDVETKPVKVWTFRIGRKVSITHEQICKGEKFDIITICWKWAGESKIHSRDWGLKKQDSTKMLEEMAKILAEADVVLGHNLDGFDLKQINTQRLLHGQGPIAWPTSEDTLKNFKKHFMFASNKLDYLAKVLLGAGKSRMSFPDWTDVVEEKSEKALKKMIAYCKRDVKLLEGVFNKASAFFTPKVHRGLIEGSGRYSCPNCASLYVVKDGIRTTRTGRYQRLKCQSCGSNFGDSRKLA